MSNLEARLVELEIKVSYQEDLTQELSKLVNTQQQAIEQFKNSFRILNEKMHQLSTGLSLDNQKDEKPPHY